MTNICFIIFGISFFLPGLLFSNAAQCPSWVDHWIHGIELTKLGKNQEALDAYSESLASIPANLTPYLYLERGFLWNEASEHTKAIEDFSRVIDSENFPETERAMALRGRASAYAKLQERKKWREDAKRADELSPLITMLYQNNHYSIAKYGGATKINSDETSDLTKFFKAFNLIDSDKDLIFSPTGLIILKKAARCACCEMDCSHDRTGAVLN